MKYHVLCTWIFIKKRGSALFGRCSEALFHKLLRIGGAFAVGAGRKAVAFPRKFDQARLSGLLGVSCDYLLCDDAAEEQGNAFGRPKQETQTAQTLNQVKVIRTRPERRLLRVLRLILIAIPQRVLLLRRPNPSQNALFRGSEAIESG